MNPLSRPFLHLECIRTASLREEDFLPDLSPGEQARSRGMTGERRKSFIVGRARLRRRLSRLYQCPPGAVRLSSESPPVLRESPLKPGSGSSGFIPSFFSFSYTRGFVFCSIARCPHGLDAETPRTPEKTRSLRKALFSPEEEEKLIRFSGHSSKISGTSRTSVTEAAPGSPPEDPATQDRLFYLIWTRREALAKASGRSVWSIRSLLCPDSFPDFFRDTPEGLWLLRSEELKKEGRNITISWARKQEKEAPEKTGEKEETGIPLLAPAEGSRAPGESAPSGDRISWSFFPAEES